MAKYAVLYNPNAGNGLCLEKVQHLDEVLPDCRLKLTDMTKIASYKEFFGGLPEGMKILICGGDGTLNRFVNDTCGIDLSNREIYYYACGSGNDFLRDVGEDGTKPFLVNRYITNLPTVNVDGKSYKFINGIGFGIDGYCCEVGDELRKVTDKPINYAAIAVKGLLGKYAPRDATVTVDGKEYFFPKSWMSPIMNGRYYGGGIMPTPERDRLAAEKNLTVVVANGSGRLHSLLMFPSILKGNHVKYKKYVHVFTGKTITVQLSEPTALQIDGETILGATSCTASACLEVPATV